MDKRGDVAAVTLSALLTLALVVYVVFRAMTGAR